MLKLFFKIAIILFAAYGAYSYFSADDIPTIEVPEVSYEDITEVIEDIEGAIEVVEEVVEVAEEVEGVVEEVVEVAEDLQEMTNSDVSEETALPAEFNLAVPFTPQAPHANWDLPYQEACEEASAYMVSMYFQGESSGLISADVADAAILELVQFEEDYFGYYLDTTAEETAQFIDLFYGLGAYVVEDPSVEDIKVQIAAGRPVIVPAAGRELGNPFFSGEGPLYHMLVIKGYADGIFIVNDPGTYRGENYVYSIDAIMNAMGDWNNGDPASGAKRVIFIAP